MKRKTKIQLGLFIIIIISISSYAYILFNSSAQAQNISTISTNEESSPFQENYDINKSIIILNNRKYYLSDDRIIEISSDNDSQAVYGIISDIHGEVNKTEMLARQFAKAKIDGIIITGDLCLNTNLRSNNSNNDNHAELSKQIKDVLEPLAKTGLPVFVIPGNHETRQRYSMAINEISKKYQNIFDMTKFRVFDGDDVDFVSLPGYQTKYQSGSRLIPYDGYALTDQDILSAGDYVKELNGPVVLITHGPPFTNSKPGPGTIFSGMDAGDKATASMVKKNGIKFVFCGHIHEAGGFASDIQGNRVKSGIWTDSYIANFGTLEEWKNIDGNTYKGMAGIATFEGNLSKFEIIRLS